MNADITRYGHWYLLSLGVVMLIPALITTYIVFFRRKADQRPMFVKVQLLLLNLYSVIWIIYFALVIHKLRDDPAGGQLNGDTTINALAVLDDTAQALYDWIFFEQFFSAGIMMPIALDIVTDEETYKRKQERAKRCILGTRIMVYVTMFCWFIIAVYTGSTLIRVCNIFAYLVALIIFFWSLRSIKKSFRKIESKAKRSDMKQDNKLINAFVILFATSMILFAALIYIAFSSQLLSDTEHTLEQCRKKFSMAIVYTVLCTVTSVRIVLSCYMSVKQSRSITDCNAQFFNIMSTSLDGVQ